MLPYHMRRAPERPYLDNDRNIQLEELYDCYSEARPYFSNRDDDLRAKRLVRWCARVGPRVGDFVRLPCGKLQRLAHDWGDSIQTTDHGSFYLYGCAHADMSGSLDPGFARSRFRDSGQIRDGLFWFFHHDRAGAHRGVYFTMPCRIYHLSED